MARICAFDLVSQYAAEFVNARVDAIVTGGDEATRALQQATKTIPISTMSGDLLESGLVNSLARPDGNTTGVSLLGRDQDGKRQEILIEAVPGLRRMAALVADDVKNTPAKLDALQQAARAQGVELSILRVARGDQIAGAIERAQASGATALNILGSALLFANAHPDYGARRRTPHTGDVFLSRTGRGRRLCRLRTAQYSAFFRSNAPTDR